MMEEALLSLSAVQYQYLKEVDRNGSLLQKCIIRQTVLNVHADIKTAYR